ncbi:Beta-hexosaminidase subunit beta [Clonorchis sinensis]|uniref:beta-N-acetylhexosaminidase n=2 Tax=Clonorchis sinensis TaxID=79923 RepID=A0A8T1M1V8_CLOSI|nr:Beta-hexosaminidase subunit beta [Clonorchis sinensis]
MITIVHIYTSLQAVLLFWSIALRCSGDEIDVNVESIPKTGTTEKDDQKKNPYIWDRHTVTPYDKLVYENSYWAFTNLPSVRIPVLRAPFPTFGMVMPLPYWWSGTERFYPVDVNGLEFQLVGVDNYILRSAISRCKQVITSRSGLSVYPNRWTHQEPLLADWTKEYQTNKRTSTRVAGTAGADLDIAERPTFWWSEKRVQWFYQIFKSPQQQHQPSTPLHRIRIYVRSSGKDWPSLQMDESYAVLVDGEQIFLVANETWGALRGLESLSQLMWRTSDMTQVYINQTYIFDKPRFPHRGLLVDTSRHFISKSILLVNLEAMAYNKLNVLHWHIVDDNSFPYQSQKFPSLSQKGAWHKRQVYTQHDIKEIVEFARLRGIRVIPEFDIPGHTRSLAYSKPELLAQCQGYEDNTVYFGPLNPFINETYQFIENFLIEMFNLFPDEYIHLGGDEVQPACWDADLEMVRTQAKLNLQGALTLDYFWKRVQNIITELGNRKPANRRKIVVWQEVAAQVLELKNSVVSQVWKPDIPGEFALSENLLFSSCWYLDNLHFIRDWVPYYLCDPLRQLDLQSSSGPTTLLGGEACMWGEYQADDTILQKIWPVTSGIAERLWSPHWVNNITTVGPRIEEQRCRMISRGIPQAVLLGPGACEFPGAITAMLGASSFETTDSHGPQFLMKEHGLSGLGEVTYETLSIFLPAVLFFVLSIILLFVALKCLTSGPVKTRLLAFFPRRLSATRILFFSVLLTLFVSLCYVYFGQPRKGA